jgi:colanic acid biosynthesis glycosyl transferase WcaI
VKETECGLLVPPENPEALAEAILQLYRDGELAREMGTRGRARVELEYTPRAIAEKYQELFETLVI